MREDFGHGPVAQVASGGTTAVAPGTSQSWTVQTVSTFPTATATSAFHIIDPAAPSEVMQVTANATSTWTVTRGVDGTTPVTHGAGFTVQQIVPASWLVQVGRNVVRDFNVQNYGALGDGTTDDYTAVMAAINAAYAAGGGTVFFPRGTYLIGSQIVLPNDGGSPAPKAPIITLMGVGARYNGLSGTSSAASASGSVLDLRSTATDGKIVSYASGGLRILDLMLRDNGASTNPFVLVTNTTLFVSGCVVQGNLTKSAGTCDQDAFVFGGTTTTVSGGPTAPFQGYGSTVRNTTFSRIRQGIYGRTYANSILVDGCSWDILCGAPSTSYAAIQFDGTVGASQDNSIQNCIFELTNYYYGVLFLNSPTNTITNSGFYDTNVNLVSAVRSQGSSSGNIMNGCAISASSDKWTTYQTYPVFGTSNGVNFGQWVFGGQDNPGLLIRPSVTMAETNALISGIRCIGTDPNPGANVFKILQNGQLYLNATTATASLIQVSNTFNGTSGVMQITGDSVIRTAGDLQLYAGTSSTQVRIMRGALGLFRGATASLTPAFSGGLFYDTTLNRAQVYDGTNWRELSHFKTYTTAGRPAANAAGYGAGASYYDTTVSKPVWSDGTTWRDAAGTAV